MRTPCLSSTSSWKTRAGSGMSKCPSRVSPPSPTRRDLHMEYGPTVADLLNVWERGCSQSPVDRALSLLQVATPESPREALAQFGIGRRDAELLKLREKV